MQITSSRHGFANAGLVLVLAIGWAWFITHDLPEVKAQTEQGGRNAATVRPGAKQFASSPHAQGKDVQARAGQAATVQVDQPELPILHNFVATAYCVKGPTASGLRVRSGMIAADPRILPIGSIVRVIAGEHSGIYSVLDTGPLITGRKIDIYLPEYSDAIRFGRRKIKIQVLRYGWDPAADGKIVAALHP